MGYWMRQASQRVGKLDADDLGQSRELINFVSLRAKRKHAEMCYPACGIRIQSLFTKMETPHNDSLSQKVQYSGNEIS